MNIILFGFILFCIIFVVCIGGMIAFLINFARKSRDKSALLFGVPISIIMLVVSFFFVKLAIDLIGAILSVI